ncbi:hypothetical protein KFL_000050140 [Klebsormidium nitens]|uniref:F-box domain-containing protein n=1 Tax=Klebsormidium nitens TaxID=105231 RepID=A0A1Y1HMV3_KLENI|nr:hypothetical protein KFL_000050140 [Klebsormidium nitens]|eukprot:GAQ77877.1 hypothetical protein KFL_000050140 [Klebsormidium nitens]
MEALDAPLFDYLLSFLTPEEACSLTLLSRSFKQALDESLAWKTFCERHSPSITTSPAREVVIKHYGGSAGGRLYKELFLKLRAKRPRKTQDCDIPQRGPLPSHFSAYVMLMDVYLDGVGCVFCSAESSELEEEFQGCQEEWEFKHPKNVGCKAVVKGTRPSDVEQTIRRRFAIPVHDKDAVLSFSWKLIRKADGKLQTLLHHRQALDGSLAWKTFCERHSPSITTSPAMELVVKHYGGIGGVCLYKQLFMKLTGKVAGEVHQNCDSQRVTPPDLDLSAHVMLMDVSMNKSQLFCSAECSELEIEFQGCQDEWEFKHPKNVGCKAVVNTMRLTPKAARRQCTTSPVEPQRSVVLFSWKLMRKADGKLQSLLDHCKPATYESLVAPEEGAEGRYHRLQASTALQPERFKAFEDGEGETYFMARNRAGAMMRLRCYDDHVERFSTFSTRSLLPEWETSEYLVHLFDKIAVEVGFINWEAFERSSLVPESPESRFFTGATYLPLKDIVKLLHEAPELKNWI